MDEKRLVEHANNYIKQMAKGINPLTGEVVSDNDLINNVKISRCLFYVSEMLDNYCNYLKKDNRGKKIKFYAKSSDLIHFMYSEEPIYVSEIVDKINECIKRDDMKKLSTKHISNWLVSKGFLTTYTKENGKVSKKPTSLGVNLGIKPIIKNGKNGSYIANVYNINAQRFIVDNIEEISKSLL